MPFSPAANPDLAGQFMAAGITKAGEALGQAAGNITEAWAKKKKIRDTYEVQGEQLGFDKNYLRSLGSDELMGLVEGKKLKISLDQIQSNINQQNQRAELEKYQLQQSKASDVGFGNAMDRFANATAPGDGVLRPENIPPVTTQDRVLNALQAPGLDERGVGALSQMLHYFNAADPNHANVRPQEMTTGAGTKLVFNPKGGNFQFEPRAPDENNLGNSVIDMVTGEPVPGLMNVNGKVFQVPKGYAPADPAKELHTTMQTVVGAETALGKIEAGIADWKMQEVQSKKNKNIPAPDPDALKSLQKRRGTLTDLMEQLGRKPTGATAAPAPATTKAKPKVAPGFVRQNGRRYLLDANGLATEVDENGVPLNEQ